MSFIDRLFSDPIGAITEVGSYIIGGGTDVPSTSGGGNYNWVMPLVTAGLGTIGAYNAPDPGGYGSTEAGFQEQMAFNREELAQRMEIARMNAAAAGSSSGAAVAAARIAADSQMAQLKKKIKADMLAKSMDASQGAVTLGQAAQSNLGSAAAQRGLASQQGLQNVAALLAGARR